MKYLYLSLDILSISVPFLASFHPKFKFYKEWKYFFPASFLSAIIYLSWDIYFTKSGFWGFNPQYLSGLYLFSLPLEEYLFFFCIPYASLFIYVAFEKLNPDFGLNEKITKLLSYSLIAFLLVLAIIFREKAYTFTNFTFAVIILVVTLIFFPKVLSKFYIAFIIILIPFFLVNGILTGSYIENEVVWYNNNENLGIRLLTIPIEDTIYAFSMLLYTLFFWKLFKKMY